MSNDTETPVPGFPGYTITPWGEVFSYWRRGPNPRIWNRRRRLATFKRGKSEGVQMYVGGVQTFRTIDSLLQTTFGNSRRLTKGRTR